MSAKKKIYKLNTNGCNYILIGIASHQNDYRLTWALNDKLNYNFIKTKDLVVYDSKLKVERSFVTYYLSDKPELNCYLIANKSEQGFLLSNMKNIDFILKISYDESVEFIKDLLIKLREIDVVMIAFILESLLDKQFKIFDF
ncbi:MAG: IPExxxVDY family protein [Bacteroidales bacterium]|nr:IPExxxVDY family protein [Bacteroidales bacterium]